VRNIEVIMIINKIVIFVLVFIVCSCFGVDQLAIGEALAPINRTSTDWSLHDIWASECRGCWH
jgi:hypothetical protein